MFPKRKLLTPGLMMLTLLSAVFGVFAKGTEDKVMAAHKASPEQYQLLLENPQVMVLKMILEPDEADKLHRHNNETVYFQQGGSLRITPQGEEAFVAHVPDGHVMWHQAWQHQVTNVGDKRVVAIIVEQK